MPKNGFPVPTAKNRSQILNLHPKKHIFKKKHGLKPKNYCFLGCRIRILNLFLAVESSF